MFDFEKNCSVKITEILKKRFCKDTNLPIKIFEEPYFANFLELYDRQFGCIEKYREFVKTVEKFGGEDKYLAAYNALKDTVINYFNENEQMSYFAKSENFNKYQIVNKGFPSSAIFKMTNDGKFFVSIDMIKGNFTALHHYDPRIVGSKDTYADFIGMFTDVKHFIDSKYIRQVVFGNVNPKRQVTYEQYLMDKVLTKLFENGIIKESVAFFSTDEIVLSVPENFVENGVISDDFVNIVRSSVDWAKSENINVRCEFFQLKHIGGTEGYMKIFQKGRDDVDFKCLDFLNFPFVLRKYYGEEVKQEDKVFLYEGKKVLLLENIDVSFD